MITCIQDSKVGNSSSMHVYKIIRYDDNMQTTDKTLCPMFDLNRVDISKERLPERVVVAGVGGGGRIRCSCSEYIHGWV